MDALRNGIPLAILLTGMNVWVTLRSGPQIWHTWGSVPWARVGILLLAGSSISTLTNVWSFILGPPSPPLPSTSGELNSAATENSDV
jgi:hypothetical protein